MYRKLLFVLIAFSGQCAWGEPFVAVAANGDSIDVKRCTGQCDYKLEDDTAPFAVVFGAYYTDVVIVDVGVEASFSDEGSLSIQLRRRFQKSSFNIGFGVLETEFIFSKGNQLTIGDGVIRTTESVPFYNVGYRHQFGRGRLLLTYNKFSDDFGLSGVQTVGFNPNGVPIRSPTSADIEIEKTYYRLGYEISF